MRSESQAERIRKTFTARFGREPLLVRSPGRINLIGEHTDYNEGFVLPAAVDRAIVFAVAPRDGSQARLLAADLGEECAVALDRLPKPRRGWSDYLVGVLEQLRRVRPRLGGFDCAFGGDIPVGAGMSSSAAVEAGLAHALDALFDLGLAPLELVKLAQRAENEYVGVRCGIMDQFVNIFARNGQVLRLDCRTLAAEHYPFPSNKLRVVLCDTGVRHALGASEYNVRRAQCEEGVQRIRRAHPDVRNLRDVTPEMLAAHRRELDPVVWRRCAYVIAENARLLAGCEDLRRGDFAVFGERMGQSHAGLRDEYEVSCPELDRLVAVAWTDPAVLGARMMGGGFGGCTVNIVRADGVVAFAERVRKTYQPPGGGPAKVYACRIEGGTKVIARPPVL